MEVELLGAYKPPVELSPLTKYFGVCVCVCYNYSDTQVNAIRGFDTEK